MALRGFPKFDLISPRKPSSGPKTAGRGWTFTRIWVACLPLSIAAISGAILMSGGDPDRRSFALFGVGIAAGIIGLVSLFVGLIQAGNAERARKRAREAARGKPRP